MRRYTQIFERRDGLAVVEMVRDGSLPEKGFIKQEEIPLQPYLSTVNGSLYLGIEDIDDDEE